MAASAKELIARIPAREWRGLVPEWAGGRLRVALTCSKCGEQDHWSATRVLSPSTIIPKVIQLGWQVGGKLVCPACLAHHSKPKNQNNVVEMKPMKPVSIPPLKPTEEPSPKLLADQKRNKRLVILALEDDFDEAARRYRPDKSDDTIAKELGLSPGFIKNVREEFYGQIAEPEEISRFRNEIEALRKMVEAMEVNLASMCKRNNWMV